LQYCSNNPPLGRSCSWTKDLHLKEKGKRKEKREASSTINKEQ